MRNHDAMPMILAIRRDEPGTADDAILRATERARCSGMRLAGVVQQNSWRAGKKKCDMDLVDLASNRVIRISEDRGDMSRGCRMDWNAVTLAAAAVEDTIRNEAVDLLIINKFGKAEEDGGGMRDAIAAAIEREVPVLLSIGLISIASLTAFAGEFCMITDADDPVIDDWLSARLLQAGKADHADFAAVAIGAAAGTG